MFAFGLLTYLADHLRRLPPDRWSVSRTVPVPAAKGSVSAHDAGVENGTAWVRFSFTVDEQPHTLRADVGSGGSETVTFDGMVVPASRLVLSNRVQGLSLRMVIEFVLGPDGSLGRYRFDGRIT